MREIAIDTTTITFVERLPPKKVWEKTGSRVTLVSELVKELKEYLFILKPERVPTIQIHAANIYERLDAFKETLKADFAETVENAQAPIDELRQALVDISGFISLCREIKAAPSQVISSILSLREEPKTDVQPATQAKMQHLGDLIKEVQASHKKIAETSMVMENQLNDIKSEYENLIFSVQKKEEE
jgi:hypothetical protein